MKQTEWMFAWLFLTLKKERPMGGGTVEEVKYLFMPQSATREIKPLDYLTMTPSAAPTSNMPNTAAGLTKHTY